MIPTFKFHGSKCRISQWILKDVSFAVNNYFEPFAGRGNVFFRFATEHCFNKAYLNDLHTSNFLVALQNYTGDYDFVPEYIDRKIFNKLRSMSSSYERDLAESFCAYNGVRWSAGANLTNCPSHPSKNKHSRINTIKRMKQAHDLLKDAEITNLDFNIFLNRKFEVDDLVYCDPPYYDVNNSLVGTNVSHALLANTLKKLSCKVIISGYYTPIYDELLSHFKRSCLTRASCGRNSNGTSKTATEYKWQNF